MMGLVVMEDGPQVCLFCQDLLLPFPVFWIDRHRDGVHLACEEQYLTEREFDQALSWEASFGG